MRSHRRCRSRVRIFKPHFPFRDVARTASGDAVDSDIYGCIGIAAGERSKAERLLVGRGKFGNVYVGADDTTVVKVYDKSVVVRERMVEQVKAEQRNHAACCQSKFIVNLLDGWQNDFKIYLVFERCSQSLKELMKSLGPPGTALPLPALYTCLAQLVPALRFVHNMGVVHRDVKLENLLVSRIGGRLQLSDFGLSARIESGKKWKGDVCGTLQYMAPEVLGGRAYGHMVDWWSTGVLVYVLAFGRFPFDRKKDHKEMIKELCHENLTKLLRHETSDLVNFALDCTMISDDVQRKIAVAGFLRRHDQILLSLAMAEGGTAPSRPFSERSLVEEALSETATVIMSTECVEELDVAELL